MLTCLPVGLKDPVRGEPPGGAPLLVGPLPAPPALGLDGKVKVARPWHTLAVQDSTERPVVAADPTPHRPRQHDLESRLHPLLQLGRLQVGPGAQLRFVAAA